jgi:hypothetical protein
MSAERLLRQYSLFPGVSNYYHDRVQKSVGTEKGRQLETWFMFWMEGVAGGSGYQGLLDAANLPNLQVGQSVFVQPTQPNVPAVDLLYFTKTGDATWEVDAFQVTVSAAHPPTPDTSRMLNELVSAGIGCTLRQFIWVGLTAVSWSADPSCGVCTTQNVADGTTFFEGRQYRLDMSQLAPKTPISTLV